MGIHKNHTKGFSQKIAYSLWKADRSRVFECFWWWIGFRVVIGLMGQVGQFRPKVDCSFWSGTSTWKSGRYAVAVMSGSMFFKSGGSINQWVSTLQQLYLGWSWVSPRKTTICRPSFDSWLASFHFVQQFQHLGLGFVSNATVGWQVPRVNSRRII